MAPRVKLQSRQGMDSLSSDEVEANVAGFRAERITLLPNAEFDYQWSGSTHYLSLHAIKLADGEAFCDGQDRNLKRDLRGTLTFVPAGGRVSGWSKLEDRPHSFTAIYINPRGLDEELAHRLGKLDLSPNLYFDNLSLRRTIEKIDCTLSSRDLPDTLYVQQLGLLCILELGQFFSATIDIAPRLGLGTKTEMLLKDYIEESLHTELNLADMAAVAGLSQFHFLRLFKHTFGSTPYQYVLQRRIACAKEFLSTGRCIEETYISVGFSNKAQFARAFNRITGITLQAYLHKTH